MRKIQTVTIGILLSFSTAVFSEEDSKVVDRMTAFEKVKAVNEATELNRQRIQSIFAEFQSGKLTADERDRRLNGWPDYGSALESARLVYTANPGDEYGLHAMKYILKYGPSGWDGKAGGWDLEGDAIKERLHIADLLVEYHIKRDDFWEIARHVGMPDMLAASFFETVFDKHSNQDVQAAAGMAIAGLYAENSTLAGLSDQQHRESREKAHKWAKLLLENYGETMPRAKSRAERVLAQLSQVIGEPMANIQTVNLDGDVDQVSNYKGKVLLIDLWATWCSPCKAAIPGLATMNEELAGKPFQLISMSVDNAPDDVIEYIEAEQSMPWVNWHVGPDNDQINALGIVGYPTYFLVDEKGILRAKSNHFGNEMRADLILLLEKAGN